MHAIVATNSSDANIPFKIDVMMPFSFLICCVYILFKFRTTLPFSVASKILEKLEYVIKYDFVWIQVYSFSEIIQVNF